MLPIVMLAPFFGAKLLPNVIKVMFCFALVTIFLPEALVLMHKNLEINFTFVGYMCKEGAIGFLMGFLIALPFLIAQASGSYIEHIRGASSLQVQDPVAQNSTAPLGILYNYVLITTFYLIGGPFYFLEAVGKSFQTVPVDGLLNPIFFSIQIPFWQQVTGLIQHVFSLSIQLGAPSIVGVLMTEMFLGIANRMAPQVQIVFLGLPLKSWVGLALLAAAWYFIVQQLGKESLSWIKTIDETIQSAKSFAS